MFYNAKLSHDGWMSCHSCHTDGHTNNLLSDTLGDGSYGAAKRVPSLLGVAATGPWTWTGSMARLEDQVRKSIATTMHGPKPTDAQVADLTAYLEYACAAIAAIGDAAPTDANRRDCRRAGQSSRSRSAARATSRPNTRHPRTLRRRPGRRGGQSRVQSAFAARRQPQRRVLPRRPSRSLEEVFRKERHPRGLVLTPGEIADLVAFLQTL